MAKIKKAADAVKAAAATFKKNKEKFAADMLAQKNPSTHISEGIQSGRIIMKSRDPKIQKAIDTTYGKAPTKKAHGGIVGGGRQARQDRRT